MPKQHLFKALQRMILKNEMNKFQQMCEATNETNINKKTAEMLC